MNELNQLWKKRMVTFWEEAIPYLRIIITGYMYIPIILLILLAFLYNYLLKAWPESWSMEWMLAILFSLFLTRNRIRTFLKDPDLIYLLPVEDHLKGYFRLSFLYSLMMQSFILLIFMLLLSPLYDGAVSSEQNSYNLIMALSLLLKGGNLYATWREWQMRSSSARQIHLLFRWGINLIFSLMLFDILSVPSVAWLILAGIVSFYYIWIRSYTGYYWFHLVQMEAKQLLAFYSFTQWFFDVPHLPVQVNRRMGWTRLLRSLPGQQKTAFHYLYSISFLRYNDRFHLYLRMVGMGMLLLYAVNDLWLGLGLFLVLLFLNALQLIHSWKRMNLNFWDALYPLTYAAKIEGFCYTVFLFLCMQVILTAAVLVLHHGWWIGLAALLFGAIASYIGIYGLWSKKLKTMFVP